MISIFEETKLNLHNAIEKALNSAMNSGDLIKAETNDFVIEVPADITKGDFATNVAMANVKVLKTAPVKIAEAIVKHFPKEDVETDKIEIAGPGFINIFMPKNWFSQMLDDVLQKAENYGRSDYGKGQKVMVEYVSANPTGPMHMGNARGGAIGDVLAESLIWAGYDTTREFYINDAGNQIEKFGISLEARYIQQLKGEDAVEFPEDAYHGDDIIEHAKAFIAENGDKYLNCDSETRKKALVDFALPKNIDKLKTDLEKYRILYDVWFKESTLHPDAVNHVINILTEKGLAYEKEGAVWYKATEFGAEKDEVLRRTNGLPTYFAADIAYHYNKFAVRKFDKVINVWGADHHGHVARLKGAMDAVGLDGNKLDIVLMQLVRLLKDGEPYRMSKRSGKSITLTNLLDEVPLDAARFFFIMREPGSTLDFDLDLAVEESSKNPVFYVQYAHARICAILKNLKATGVEPKTLDASAFDVLSTESERELIRALAQLPQVIVTSAKDYDPAKISTYASTVATAFHKFYTTCRIKDEADEILYPRLALCVAAKTVLNNVLSILKVTAPEVM